MVTETMIAERLRDRRLTLGLTQADVAEAIGVSPKTVSHWENGGREPDIDTIKSLSRCLRTSMAYLVGETDDPTPLSARAESHADDIPIERQIVRIAAE